MKDFGEGYLPRRSSKGGCLAVTCQINREGSGTLFGLAHRRFPLSARSILVVIKTAFSKP